MQLFFNNKKDKEFAIVGLGRFGGSLARRLESLGHPDLGIDIDPRVVKKVGDEITEAVILDATDEDALHQVDISAFQTVVVAIAENFEANALITTTLKQMNIPQVVTVSNTHRHRDILLRIGADRVILPQEESGYQLADELSIPGMLERLHLTPDYSLIEIKTPRGLVGKPIDAAESHEVIVVLILRQDKLIINPEPDALFLEDDILVLVGEKRRLAEFSTLR